MDNSISTQVFRVAKVESKLTSRNTLPLEEVFYVLEVRRNLNSESLLSGGMLPIVILI